MAADNRLAGLTVAPEASLEEQIKALDDQLWDITVEASIDGPLSKEAIVELLNAHRVFTVMGGLFIKRRAAISTLFESYMSKWGLTEREKFDYKLELTQTAKKLSNLVPLEGGKGKRDDRPKHSDYVDFLLVEVPTLRRCFLSGELMWESEPNVWRPIKNRIGALKSKCRDKYPDLYPSHLEDELAAYCEEAEPRMLVDVPAWDGRDRIGEMCAGLIVTNFTPAQADALVKDWARLMWKRLADPFVRGAMLVLKGPQKIGKDWWIEALVGGFREGGYFKTLQTHDEREMFRQLHRAAVFTIPEMRKATARHSVEVIKHLITTPSTDERLPYDRADESRFVYASFIGSANVESVFNDPTGATRFVVLEISGITKGYPGHVGTRDEQRFDRLQVLAQCRTIAEADPPLPADIEATLSNYLADNVPSNPDDTARETWFEVCALLLRDLPSYPNGKCSCTEAIPAIQELSNRERKGVNYIKSELKRLKLTWRTDIARGYYIKNNNVDDTDRMTTSSDDNVFDFL